MKYALTLIAFLVCTTATSYGAARRCTTDMAIKRELTQLTDFEKSTLSYAFDETYEGTEDYPESVKVTYVYYTPDQKNGDAMQVGGFFVYDLISCTLTLAMPAQKLYSF